MSLDFQQQLQSSLDGKAKSTLVPTGISELRVIGDNEIVALGDAREEFASLDKAVRDAVSSTNTWHLRHGSE